MLTLVVAAGVGSSVRCYNQPTLALINTGHRVL